MTRSEFIVEARSWQGVPFRHQGRSRLAVDCLGYVMCLVRACGEVPAGFVEPLKYGRAPNTSEFIDTVERYCTPLDVIEDGCMIAVAWPKAKFPAHAAIIDGKYMIHAYQRKGCVVRNTYGEPWLRMTRGRAHAPGIYRLPGITP